MTRKEMIDAINGKAGQEIVNPNNDFMSDEILREICYAKGILSKPKKGADKPTTFKLETFTPAGKNAKAQPVIRFEGNFRPWSKGPKAILQVLENKDRCLENADLQPYGLIEHRVKTICEHADALIDLLAENDLV